MLASRESMRSRLRWSAQKGKSSTPPPARGGERSGRTQGCVPFQRRSILGHFLFRELSNAVRLSTEVGVLKRCKQCLSHKSDHVYVLPEVGIISPKDIKLELLIK